MPPRILSEYPTRSVYIYILPDQTDLLITGKTLFQTTIGRETRGGGGGKLMIP